MGRDRLQEFDTVYFPSNEFRPKNLLFQIQSCKHGGEDRILKIICFLCYPFLFQKYAQGSALQQLQLYLNENTKLQGKRTLA